MTQYTCQCLAVKDWISDCLYFCEERISVLSEHYSTEAILNGYTDDFTTTRAIDLFNFEADKMELHCALELVNKWRHDQDGEERLTINLHDPNSYPALNLTERLANLCRAEIEAFRIH